MNLEFKRVWGRPIVLGILTASGLGTALLSEGGWGDVWSWVGLGIPVAVMAWHWAPRRASQTKD